jgi:hypothetical protein
MHIMISNYASRSRVMLQIVPSITIIIYDCNMFVLQATGSRDILEISDERLRETSYNILHRFPLHIYFARAGAQTQDLLVYFISPYH